VCSAASYVGWQRDTARPHLLLSAMRPAAAAVGRYLLPARRSAANPLQRRTNGGTDGQTDGRPTVA